MLGFAPVGWYDSTSGKRTGSVLSGTAHTAPLESYAMGNGSPYAVHEEMIARREQLCSRCSAPMVAACACCACAHARPGRGLTQYRCLLKSQSRSLYALCAHPTSAPSSHATCE